MIFSNIFTYYIYLLFLSLFQANNNINKLKIINKNINTQFFLLQIGLIFSPIFEINTY